MIKDIFMFLLLFTALYGGLDYAFIMRERYKNIGWDKFFEVKTWVDTIVSAVMVAIPAAFIFVFFALKMKFI